MLNIFLDSSVAIAASLSATGASREVFNHAASHGWRLFLSPWVLRIPGSTKFAGSALTAPEGVANIGRWLHLEPEPSRALFSTTIARVFGISLPLITTP